MSASRRWSCVRPRPQLQRTVCSAHDDTHDRNGYVTTATAAAAVAASRSSVAAVACGTRRRVATVAALRGRRTAHVTHTTTPTPPRCVVAVVATACLVSACHVHTTSQYTATANTRADEHTHGADATTTAAAAAAAIQGSSSDSSAMTEQAESTTCAQPHEDATAAAAAAAAQQRADDGEARLNKVFAELQMCLPTITHEPKLTVEAANEELHRFDVPCSGTKNMFLKGKKGELVLVTALSSTTTDMRRIQDESGVKALRFAPLEVVVETLGVERGAVTPFALVHNTAHRDIMVLLDRAMMESGVSFVLHPCRNDKSCLVTAADLRAFLEHLGVTYKIVDFGADAHADPSAAAQPPSQAKQTTTTTTTAAGKKASPSTSSPPTNSLTSGAGETKLGLTKRREDNFPEWYTEVVVKAEMIEYYDVSGCYIIRPWAFYIWKTIQRVFGDRIERMGIEDCYFPMFVSRTCLEREKDHIDGFAPEVAWVTRAGNTDLEVPVAIRPTSETVMYPYYAKWVRSYRDLPIRLNAWNNVIRWEFSHPMPFIRTREFLWQEGHCAWEKREDCAREVRDILEGYAAVYEDLLAVPVVRGRKSDHERFAGADYSLTVETFIEAVGRGCQGGTSHFLGQNFGKIFGIGFQDPDKNDGSTLVPWQNSWGLSTRVIGVMIMVHADNQGLVMPPRVAQVQVVIVPVGITKDTTEEAKQTLIDRALGLERELSAGGVRARADLRLNYSPGWRFNDWELKGVPIRIELGPKELQSGQLQLALRYNGERRRLAWDGTTAAALRALLDDIHAAMYARACAVRNAHMREVTAWDDFVTLLNRKCILLAPWCRSEACEVQIKKDSAEESKALLAQQDGEDARAPSMGAKSLCIPFEQPRGVDGLRCICKSCDKPAETWGLFGRSY